MLLPWKRWIDLSQRYVEPDPNTSARASVDASADRRAAPDVTGVSPMHDSNINNFETIQSITIVLDFQKERMVLDLIIEDDDDNRLVEAKPSKFFARQARRLRIFVKKR